MKPFCIALAMALPALTFASGLCAADAPPGAAACSGCHPASANVDTPAPRLIGHDAAAIASSMQAYRSGQVPGTIMDRIAKGFSEDEIKAIAAWYGAIKD